LPEPTPPHRIALLGHRLASPSATGIGRYYVEISRGLASVADPTTHRYVVASTREAEQPAWLPDGLEHRPVPGPRKALALSWALLGRPSLDGPLGHPDLVHALHPWTATPCRAPLVTTIHDLMPMLHPEWHGRVESWSFRRGVAHARDHASAIITESQFAADLITAETGIAADRIRVIWGGAGDEFRRRPSTAEADEVCARFRVQRGRYLIVVGAVSNRKNLTVLLRALTQVDPALLGPTALLAAGPPGLGADAIQGEVDRLALHDRVHFGGYVATQDLPVLVGSSLALVHPSRDEGFGITPIEAMAAGVPAIASDAGSIPEVAGAAAVLVDPDDVDGWAAAITTVATDPDRRAQLVQAGDRHQERFRWGRAATETMAVHDQVLRTR
jgi:glycosyltransferase involved in cell wall biosynthesis